MNEVIFVPIYDFDRRLNQTQNNLVEKLLKEGWKKVDNKSILEKDQWVRYDFIVLNREQKV